MWDYLSGLANTAYDFLGDAASWLSGTAWPTVRGWVQQNPWLALQAGMGVAGLVNAYQAQQALNQWAHRAEQERRAGQAAVRDVMANPTSPEAFLPPPDVQRQLIMPYIQERYGTTAGGAPLADLLREQQRQFWGPAAELALARDRERLAATQQAYGQPVPPQFAQNWVNLAAPFQGFFSTLERTQMARRLTQERAADRAMLREWLEGIRGAFPGAAQQPQAPPGTGPFYAPWGDSDVFNLYGF